MSKFFENWFSEKRDLYVAILKRYIEINTTSPNEDEAFFFIAEELGRRGFSVDKQSINKKIWKHPFHCSKYLSKITDKSYNIIAKKFFGSEKTILMNCHIDVVPGSDKFRPSFNPEVIDDKVFGRGACDTKNNFIMLLGALDYLDYIGRPSKKNLIIHLPIEEEVGGNGTLSMALHHKDKVDYAIVFEPTNFEIFRGHRGCITFDITIFGKPTHMGQGQKGLSAIDLSIKVIENLKKLEDKLLQASKGNVDFSKWERPLQLNIGTIQGGEWHGSIPEKAYITGNLGFLPDISIEEAMQMICFCTEDVVNTHGGLVCVDFKGLKNNPYIMPKNEPVISEMINACKKNGIEQTDIYGWNVSCDARIYYNELAIPTIIFGCGQLENAHSNHENIAISELGIGMKIISDFLLD